MRLLLTTVVHVHCSVYLLQANMEFSENFQVVKTPVRVQNQDKGVLGMVSVNIKFIQMT